MIKDGYFEFQIVDNTSYKVPAQIDDQLLGTAWILILNSIVCFGIISDIKSEQKVDSQKVKSK